MSKATTGQPCIESTHPLQEATPCLQQCHALRPSFENCPVRVLKLWSSSRNQHRRTGHDTQVYTGIIPHSSQCILQGEANQDSIQKNVFLNLSVEHSGISSHTLVTGTQPSSVLRISVWGVRLTLRLRFLIDIYPHSISQIACHIAALISYILCW